MIKKKLLALGVSAVAVTAVVGAGFAGWTFTSEAREEQKLGIHITAAYSFGAVAVKADAPDTVVLDQSGVILAKSGALGAAIADVSAEWTVNTASYTDAVAKGLTYSVNIYVNAALSAYVNCGSTAAEATSSKDDYTQYKFAVTPAADAITTSGDNTVVTITLSNPLAYTAAKPDTFDKYADMVAAIVGVGKNTVANDTAYDVAATEEPVVIEFTVDKATV